MQGSFGKLEGEKNPEFANPGKITSEVLRLMSKPEEVEKSLADCNPISLGCPGKRGQGLGQTSVRRQGKELNQQGKT